MDLTVVVTAARSPLGRRVCPRIAADPQVGRLVAIDRPGTGAAGAPAAVPPIEHHALELTDPGLVKLLEGADVVVHLGSGAPEPGRRSSGPAGTAPAGADEVGEARALLGAAAEADVPALVVLSSAMVYGAWPGNPVPLTEAAPLRPVPGLDFAVHRAEIERLADSWRRDRRHGTDHRTVAVLRPVLCVGPDQPPWLGRSRWSPSGLLADDDAPVQFVHLDDVAAAVDLARRRRLDGPFNVAPDGWLSAADRRRLAGPLPRLPIPAPVAERLASLRWRLRLTGVPPSVLPYTMHPWVVANDRLRAAGWEPAHSNEEAFVEADPGSPLATVDPRRRQLLSLGVLAVPVLAVAAGAVVGVRRLLRRRR